ncbi:MAG: DUF998 domain-containing protein [Gammaproteobacteria bacterium]
MTQAARTWFGRLALAGVLLFFITSAATQFLRPDYNFMGTPLSFYLLGAYGGWLQAAFFVLACSLVLLTVGYYLASPGDARSAATLILFIAGAAGVVITASFATDTSDRLTLHGALHVLGAMLAFLCVSVAMLSQSWYLRRVPRWQSHFRLALGLALAEFVVLWLYALGHIPARGFMEKLTILLILAWLALAAWWLQEPPRRDAAPL